MHTTEALSHGENQRIDGFVSDRRRFALSKPGFRYFDFTLHQEVECAELRFTQWV